ncbi:MAG: hypothetical protein LBF22_13620, partial [Deltaproteobacteria bacterium]|nr:hypothetical protein [Deltaproteobacteria bacterium]
LSAFSYDPHLRILDHIVDFHAFAVVVFPLSVNTCTSLIIRCFFVALAVQKICLVVLCLKHSLGHMPGKNAWYICLEHMPYRFGSKELYTKQST